MPGKSTLYCLLAFALIGGLSACGGSSSTASNGAAMTAAASGMQTTTAAISSPGSVPPAAAAVGYQTNTFGPEVTLSGNWFDMNFFHTFKSDATQNGDGTVSLTGNGQGIASAMRDLAMPNQWRGVAFGGGAYFEAVFHFANADDSKLAQWPAFWSLDIENLSQNAVTELTQWSGQPQGFGNWIEPDFFEYDRQSVSEYGIQIHNWYGFHNFGQVQEVLAYIDPVRVPHGFDWSEPHKYGYLWVPATATTRGYTQTFMDDVQVGAPVYWKLYDPQAPPPPQPGTTAFSVLDSRHLVLLIETGPKNPMTIETVSVWQASGNGNLTQ